MDDLSRIADEIARDLWQRFRVIALVMDKEDAFVGMTPSGEAVTDAAGRWLKQLSEDKDEINEVANDCVLRAFRTALEPVNYQILLKLRDQLSVSIFDLMESENLNRFTVGEHVNDLVQVGLAIQDTQTSQVQATDAARRLMEIIRTIQTRLSDEIQKNIRDI